MYELLLLLILSNCLCTIVLTSSANNRIVRDLKRIVDTALEQDSNDEINHDALVEQLSEILEHEEGFRIVDHQQRTDEQSNLVFDGSGLVEDDKKPVLFYPNITIVTFTMGTTAAELTTYKPQAYSSPPCRCEKGERGDKGDAGICPADCRWRYETSQKDCVGSMINVQQLAQSIRQLIIDTKRIAYRNARTTPCTCPTPPPTTPFSLDYNMYARLKGDKGDPGTSCSPTCTQSTQNNIRVFRTLQDALDSSYAYPDHTYVHIINDYGRLQSVLIKVRGQLVPLRIESEHSTVVHDQPMPSTALSIPKPLCTKTLGCPRLHMFALGPNVRRMCPTKRGNNFCSKLSEYDNLCRRVSEQRKLNGFYRAFMSSSTQWLSNLFEGICVNARIVNMHEQTLFDRVEDIFEQKAPQSEILDVGGLRPEIQYWWHGTLVNGTASVDTCLDWSRYDSNLSGMVTRILDTQNGLFYSQLPWPCSVGDANSGILCIETNCNRNNYYKH